MEPQRAATATPVQFSLRYRRSSSIPPYEFVTLEDEGVALEDVHVFRELATVFLVGK